MKKLAGASWKMNKTVEEALLFFKEFTHLISIPKDGCVFFCLPYMHLWPVQQWLAQNHINIALGSQNHYWEDQGPYTGEISAMQIASIGCEYAEIGHHERRLYFHETDEIVNKKLKAALKNKLTPIVCIGENKQERESGKTEEVLEKEIQGGLKGFNKDELKKVILAYEPIWAIGTGITATPQQVEQAHHFIKDTVSKQFGLNKIRVIYGGSVNPEKTPDLIVLDNVDGLFVGTASLLPESFAKIVKDCCG